jgi:rhodanese-related sulfurtransferase
MKTTKMWLVAMIFLAFAAVSCDNSEDDPVDEAMLMVEYLESAEGGDYANTYMPAIKGASDVKTGNTAGTNYIVDIRAEADFNDGHIENAVLVSPGEVLTHLEGTSDDDGKEVIIVCYTGQTAGWVTALLRMAGYDNAFSMKFGMCAWHNDFAGKWNNNTSNDYASVFEKTDVAKGPEGNLPEINTGLKDGKEILDARIAEIFAEGFGAAKVTNQTVIGATESYYIVNYWGKDDYDGYGHIPSAMQYTPKQSIALDADLLTLPTDKPVVVYCWTGQTSANMAAYLRVLGYDAKSLLFGANGMIYDELTGHKWSEGAIMGYDYVSSN